MLFASTRSLAVVVALVVVAAVAADAQALNPRPYVGDIRKELHNTVLNPQKISKNMFNAQLYPTANTTYFAGQEVRMRVSTVFFSLESFRYGSTLSTYFSGDAAHNSKLPLSQLWTTTVFTNLGYRNATILNETLFPAFNVTGPSAVRVRVVAAYSSRASSSGQQLSCNSATDVWHEFWGMSGRSTAWGRDMAFSGYVTLTVPPFHWKVCVKDATDKNTTRDGQSMDTTSSGWTEFRNDPGVQSFMEPLYLWYGSSTMSVGDYAAIRVVANGRGDGTWNSKSFDPFDFAINNKGTTQGDQMKLVPAGFPCTYEKMSSNADYVHNLPSFLATTTKQYCGSNYIHPTTGAFVNGDCSAEGSIQEGVIATGSNAQNPYQSHSTLTAGAPVASGRSLVGYLKLPAAGNYDICYSPKAYRLSLLNVSATPYNPKLVNAVPVWFKLFKTSGSCPTSNSYGGVAACSPRTMMLTTTAISTHTVTWSAIDTTPGSWGTIKFTGSSASLSSVAATAWEYSSTREYFQTAGGDQFRLVPDDTTNIFKTATMTTFGDLYKDSNGNRLMASVQTAETSTGPTYSSVQRIVSAAESDSTTTLSTASAYKLTQYFFGQPGVGTMRSTSGCWYHAFDNYGNAAKGLFGNPGSQCCGTSSCTGTTCSASDSGDRGPTASGDLGGNPRLGYSAWEWNDASQTDVWGYVRFPKGGRYRVCYRKVGVENWREIPVGSTPVGNNLVAGAMSFMPQQDFDQFNVTYHINDTRANTWAEARVYSATQDLTTENLNYYEASSTVADSAVVGSAFKIASYLQSCYVDNGVTNGYSMTPGTSECTMGQCSGSESCAGCAGSADDSSTKRFWVSFYVRIPSAMTSTSTFYRVCFKKGIYNWNMISDPNFVSHRYSTNAWFFNPLPAAGIDYILADNREGTWGKFIFRRRQSPTVTYTYATAPLNSDPNNKLGDGDVFRLVRNETDLGKEVFCDVTWGAASNNGDRFVQQNFQPLMSKWDLGIYCSGSVLTSTSQPCASTKIKPSVNSIYGMDPYENLDATADYDLIPSTEGTVGFITLPASLASSRPLGYKVCYKQAHLNWVEAVPAQTSTAGAYQPSFLPIATKPSYTASVGHHTRLVAGMYGYVEITGSSTDVITRATDLVKLVADSAHGCDRAAAGTQSYYNNYISFAGASHSRGSAYIVDGTSTTNAESSTQATTVTKARAYMVFPTVLGKSVVETKYKVCYMVRSTTSTTTQNWQHLLTVTVRSTGVVYTAQNAPVYGAAFSIKFISGGTNPLNTEAGKDQAKLVADTHACFDYADSAPLNIRGSHSLHTGLETAGMDLARKTSGATDLGPANDPLTSTAVFQTTLPYSVTDGRLKVCYRIHGQPWFEVEQAPVAELEYGLGETGVAPAASGLTSMTISSSIRGQSPGITAQEDYATNIAYTSTALGGISTVKYGTTNTTYFYVTFASSYTASTSDKWKLVPVAVEGPQGTFTAVPGNCFSQSEWTGTAGVSGTSFGLIWINMPQSGRWMLCYQRSGTTAWVQVQNASTYGNPFTVAMNRMTFTADTTTQLVTVSDLWAVNDLSQGGLSADDTVYMVNRTDVCGMAHSFNNLNLGGSTTQLKLNNPSAANYMARRATSSAAEWLSSTTLATFTGFFKLCVYRSQSTNVNVTSGTTVGTTTTPLPYLQSSWYQVENVGSSNNGGGTAFFANTAPSKLIIDSCPPFNLTRRIRTGQTFDVTVFTADSTNTKLPFSVGTYAYQINAGPSDELNPFQLQNTGGDCASAHAPTFGWDKWNLRQYTSQGKVTFTLAAVGPCPTSGCSFRFSTPTASISASPSCTFNVLPTTVARLATVEGLQTTCHLGKSCMVRIAAYHTDNMLAYQSTDAVTVTPTNFAGLSIKMNSATTLSGATSAGALANGFFSATFEFTATDGAVFTADKAVTLSFTANSRNTSHTFTVLRPIMSSVHIVDLYPDAVLSGDVFLRSSLVPTWEPASTTYWRGGHDVANGLQQLTAGAGYHLVAQQFYAVVFRAVAVVAGKSEYISDTTLLDASKAITIVQTTLNTAGNAVIRASGCTDESCRGAFSSQSFSAVKQSLKFRLRNAKGCSKAAGGCTIRFQFGGADLGGITSITTPVRSLAVSLSGQCWADDGVAAYDSTVTGGSSACPSSSVEKGWLLKVTAVDQNGDVDEYFDGNVIPVVRGGTGMVTDSGVNLTTVADLSNGRGVSLMTIKASSGIAWVPTLTLSRPCSSGCSLQVLSDWGANVLEMGNLVATPSTAKLQCTLSSALGACSSATAGEACDSISGALTSVDNTLNSLLYKDTPMCVTVTAVNADTTPVPTLYETNWVLYYAKPEGGVPLTVTDVNDNVGRRRYKPMFRSSVRFCFKVSGDFTVSTTFTMKFVAQRFNDAGYWAQGTNGECSLGVYTVWAQKHMASLKVTRAEGMDVITTLPAGAVTVATQRSTADPRVKLDFAVYDHYGNAIATTDLKTTQQNNYVIISKCTLDGTALVSTCTTGTTGASAGSPDVVLAGTGAETGALSVTVISDTSTPKLKVGDGSMTYTLELAKWCIGCTVSFNVYDSNNAAYTTKSITTGNDVTLSNTVNLNVLMAADSSVVRRVAFKKGTSPLTTPHWQLWTSGSTSFSSGTVMFSSSCFSLTSTCKPKETLFLQAACDPRGATSLTSSSAGAAIQMYVVMAAASTNALDSKKEPICGGSGTQLTCGTSSNIVMQVDILNSYSIGVSIGQQLLTCTGTACANDGTATVSQTVNAFGATAKDAITAFTSFRATSFVLQGINPSDYYAVDSSSNLASPYFKPTQAGTFTAAASVNATGSSSITVESLTSSGEFAWRGPAIAKAFVVRGTSAESVCRNKPTYNCHSGTTGTCALTGYQQKKDLDTIAFPYDKASNVIPTGVEFPVTVEVQDATPNRVWTAAGTVTVQLESWLGCNNGGTMTIRGASNGNQLTLDNGRVTAFVTFSQPCQNCILRFDLAPSSTQSALFVDMSANPASFIARSKPIQVSGAVRGNEVLLTSDPAAQASALTIADVVTVNAIVVGNLGNMQVNDAAASATIAAYNTIQTTASNWWWVGNGGVLRSAKDRAFTDRHATHKPFIGSTSLTFMFTRTCPNGCTVTIFYSVNGGATSGTYLVKNANGNSFTVTTAQSQQVLVGYRPRNVRAGSDLGVGVWHVGSELAAEATNPIAIAGVASADAPSLARISNRADVSTNGDGGVLTTQGFMTTRAEAHRIRFSVPCNKCTLSVAADSLTLNVYTMATHIRVVLPGETHFTATHPMGSQYFSFNLRAIDNDGRVDTWFGGNTDCAFSLPFVCPASASATVTATLSADGRSSGGFVPSGIVAFQSADSTKLDGTFNTGKSTLVNGIGSVEVNWNTPARHGYPLFASAFGGRTLTSARPTGIFAPVPTVDISPGVNNLEIQTQATPGVANAVAFSPMTVRVGLVTSISGTAARFVSPEADNEITASFAASCPVDATTQTTKLEKGMGMFRFVFNGPTTTDCQVTITAGAGRGNCQSGSACTTTLSITVAGVTVSKWVWVRPTAMDNGNGLSAGPFFGAAGRRSYLTVGLRGTDSNNQDIVLRSCDDPSTTNVETCTLSVTASCANSPTIEGAGTFNANGLASVTVLWRDAGANRYECQLNVQVTRGSATIAAPTSGPGAGPVVTVCNPARVVMQTNTTADFRGMVLKTGVPYTFYAVMVDANGQHCRGDSQDDATQLTVEAVTNERVPRVSDVIRVVNVNVTETTTAAITRQVQEALRPAMPTNRFAPPRPTPAMNSVKAVGGGYAFSVVFSNSTMALGLTGIRVRVTAQSATPLISGASAEAISGAVDTSISAMKLRFRPETTPPRFVVTGRDFKNPSMGTFVVQAVDNLEMAWVQDGLLPRAPNVARRTTEPGNNAEVMWAVEPALDGAFPISFRVGSQRATLTRGEMTYSGLQWSGRDGTFALQVSATGSKTTIMPTMPYEVTMQLPVKILMNTSNFRPTATQWCDTNCILPNRTFGYQTENVTNVAFLNTSSIRAFNVSLYVADAKNLPVIGDDESVIQVSLVNPSTTTTIQLGLPDAYTRTGPFFARARSGRVQFMLGFIGSTEESAGNHSRVRLSFSCPENRPMPLLRPGEAPANPCYNRLSALQTQTIQVGDSRPSPQLFTDPTVANASPIVKIPTGLNSLADFNSSDFAMTLGRKLGDSGFGFISAENANSVMRVMSCEVNRAVFGSTSDLGDTVCGASNLCTTANPTCPTGVSSCSCPGSSARAMLLNRYLLQGGNQVQVELGFALDKAVGFTGGTSDILNTFDALGKAAANILTNDPELAAAFSIDTANVGTTTAGAEKQTPPPVTPPPTPQPPIVTNPPTPVPAAAPAVSVLAALVVAILAALLL